MGSVNLKFVTSYLIVQIAPNHLVGNHSARVGFTASKKIGNAVKRNYAKRIMRTLVVREKNQLLKSTDYVFIARRAILNEKYSIMEGKFIDAIKRVNNKISLQELDGKPKIFLDE